MTATRSTALRHRLSSEGLGDLVARLEARRSEIEQAVLTRVYSLDDPGDVRDPAYLEGLRAAVSAALDYGIAGVERGEARPAPIPAALLGQARFAARNGVGLDTVLRRYFAGHAVLGDFLHQEAPETGGLPTATLRRLRRDQAALLDRLLAAVAEEYEREVQVVSSPSHRRTERVRRLLAGEILDTGELAYDFDAWHLGVVASGDSAGSAVRELALACDRQLLLVEADLGAVWAWLGGRTRPAPDDLLAVASACLSDEITFALGEPVAGIEGWRLTHRQAAAAWPIACGGPQSLVRYADVAMLASGLRDDVLCRSLGQLYLLPLAQERDGGEVLRQTLRAYFAAERNVSSAAAALGVSRRTVTSRLGAVERHLERPLSACAAGMEVALRLEEAGRFTAVPN